MLPANTSTKTPINLKTDNIVANNIGNANKWQKLQ